MDKFGIQAKITTPAEISKVLNISVSSTITSSEMANGIISISGKSQVSVIYLSAEQTIEHIDEFVDFTEKQQVSFVLDDLFANDSSRATKVSVSGNEIVCVIDHEVSVSGNYKYEIPDFSEISNDFVFDKKTLNTLKFVSSCEDNFAIAEEFESSLTGVSILSSRAKAEVLESSVSADKVVVEGKVYLEIICGEQDGATSVCREFEFKQEIGLNGALPTMQAKAFVSAVNVIVTPEEKESKTNFVCSVDMFAKCLVYEEGIYELALDMFSLKNNLKLTYDYIEANVLGKEKNYSDTVLCVSDVSHLENLEDMVGVFLPTLKIVSVEDAGETVVVNGELSAVAIYKTQNSYDTFEVVENTKFELQKDANEKIGCVDAIATLSSFKVKAGKDLEIVCKIEYSVGFNSIISERYVRSFDSLEEKPVDQFGVKVYITDDGEKLFDISKKLNVNPEAILSQNDVSEMFEGGEKIYVYSPINLL